MKGDIKPMGNQLAQVEKGFKVSIVEQKQYVPQTTLVKQQRQDLADFLSKDKVAPKYEQKENLNFKSLLKSDHDIETKTNLDDNPFAKFGEELKKYIFETEGYEEDINNIILTGRSFIYDFFACARNLSSKILTLAMDKTVDVIRNFYNVLSSKQVNDYVDLFLIIFKAYLEMEPTDDEEKFKILHNGLLEFFINSLKNKNEEMLFLFNKVFIKKIFEAINDRSNINRLDYLCNLLYTLLDPNINQQVELFKMFKENINKENEEILYKCFAILHDQIPKLHYSENLIDACLFYILNGINHENPNIRNYSLQMLHNYGMLQVNFIYNFKKVLTKLAKKESDKENCLLLIEIFCQILRDIYTNPPEERKTDKRDNEKPEDINKAREEEIKYANSMIGQIVERNQGDEVFMLLFSSNVYEFLYDNYELYKILLQSLYLCSDNLFSCIFYGQELTDERITYKYKNTIFRTSIGFETPGEMSKPMLFKAFSLMLGEREEMKQLQAGKVPERRQEERVFELLQLTEKDYEFLRFLTKDKMENKYSEIWKTGFDFYKLVIKDLFSPRDPKKVSRCLAILESFLLCEPIQKIIFDEWYEHLYNVFKEDVMKCDDPDCRNELLKIIIEQMTSWGNNNSISQIVKDDLKKLMEVFPKEFIVSEGNHSVPTQGVMNASDIQHMSGENKNLPEVGPDEGN
ncbi:MAG: hypothetical protein MJ252_18530 [archaeon]|nr:hypothetical protein [archaeon]